MAYTTATLLSKEQTGESVRLIVEFTGNAGEPPVRRDYGVSPSTTLADIRQWAFRVAASLGTLKSVADNLNPGMSITLNAPPAPPAATALDIWREKVERLVRVRAFALTNATAVSELAALQADVNATYQAGFLTNA